MNKNAHFAQTILYLIHCRAFGELKSVRIPKKMVQGSEDSHRGFGFVDYDSKSDAKVKIKFTILLIEYFCIY